jgi:Fe-S oxidoreductase
LRKFNIPHKFEFTSIIQLYAQWIREGKLKVNSDWNRDLKIKFTVQDPCNIVRKTLREEMADELRFVVKTVVGEENFVDMVPCGVNNYCCGGGGGALQGGFTQERRAYGKVKYDQVMATGAKYVIAPCHNCHSQIEDMGHHYRRRIPRRFTCGPSCVWPWAISARTNAAIWDRIWQTMGCRRRTEVGGRMSENQWLKTEDRRRNSELRNFGTGSNGER